VQANAIRVGLIAGDATAAGVRPAPAFVKLVRHTLFADGFMAVRSCNCRGAEPLSRRFREESYCKTLSGMDSGLAGVVFSRKAKWS
jgi:hypothetical protein